MVSITFPIKKQLGFTMVELLIVLGILGILVTTGFTAYTATLRNSRDAKRKTDLETIRQALELYKSDNGSYPVSDGWCTVLWGCGDPSSPTWPEVRDALINGGYLTKLPQDPLYANTKRDYFFYRIGTGYSLYAQQEGNPTNAINTGGCGCSISLEENNDYYDYQVTNP